MNCHVRPEDVAGLARDAGLPRPAAGRSPPWRHEYGRLKRRLAAVPHDSVDAYAEAKTPFVRRVLAGSRSGGMSLSVAALSVGPCDRRPTSSAPWRPSGWSPTSSPSGDQPQAIAELAGRVQRRREGRRAAGRDRHRQVGDHGLADREGAAAHARARAQQDPRRAAGERVPRAAAAQRRRVLRLVLRLLPARGVHPADRHLHREGLLDQRGGRAAAALGDQLAADPPRRHRRRVGVVHLRPGHPAGVRRPDGPAQGRRAQIERDELLRRFVQMQYTRNDLAFTRGTFRVRGDTVEIIPVYEELAVRIEFFGDEIDRIYTLHPLTGEIVREEDGDVRLPRDALRRRAGADGAGDRRHRGSSSPTGSPSSSGRASCSRPSGCACGRPTTSR